ncbi:MAG: chromosome segregation protein SMC [Myxococcota bacterium]|nr:chromosome segregation protein SMC [Myxococcota bacterium]
MKIKKLELYGFKSFVDRTILQFDHDMLGIVGPNGCGKSNIVDAIRWCMGEQSARHLRGRSMEDVIFNGSETRSSHDLAEVTITFDNDAPEDLPLLPFEYKAYAEIAVTRRLHRTGESEYLINKTPVRLRDVTDLFLGTGAGTKAYSIVEQGKVGLIVSAKPEDRRLLLEEAAGITKFKSRKKQAERKMELTQQNLLRVGDIVAEIERNVASLRRQAAKAERYVAYRTELEDLQLHEAAHRYLELVGWIKLEGREVEQLLNATKDVRTEVDAREAELEAARLQAHAAEQGLDSAQSSSFVAENSVRTEEAAIERATDRIKSLEHREHQAGAEKREMTEQAARLATERDAVERDVGALQEQENGQLSLIAAEEGKLSDFAGAHAVADARVIERRQAIAKGQAQIASAEAMLAGFERRRDEMAARFERHTGERESLDAARVENAARALELRRSFEDLRAGRVTTAAEKARFEERLAELKTQIHAQDRALEESKGELSTTRSRYGALEEIHARLDGVGAGTKALVGTRDACVAGCVADRVEAPMELTQALAGLLGARLQDVVVRDVERGVALLEELARGQKGRAAIVPLYPSFVAGPHPSLPHGVHAGVVGRLADALRFSQEDEALVRSLVGDALVVRDIACARRLRDGGIRTALVTLDGAVLYEDGRIAGGQGDAVAAGMLESKREARELAKEIDRLESVVTHRLDALQLSRAEIAQTGAALDRARHEAHARELALVTAEKDLQKTEERVEGVVARLSALAVEEVELDRAMHEARVERDEAALMLSEARARVEIAEGELRDADAALAEADHRLDVQRQAVTSCKVTVAATREKLAGARGAASRLARSAAELEERARRLEDELIANAGDRAETASQLLTHKEQLHVALDRARDAQDELARSRAEFERLRGALLEREAALKDLRTRFNAVREQLQAHEMALRERQLALEHLLGAVGDKFRGLDLPRIIGDYHLRPPPDEVTRARIDELVRLIERMGSVNLDAMREHEESQQRYAFYTTQKADLEKALADLTRAIQHMNRESRRLFQETFDAVNARFREIFPRMFRGGRAELRMTSPEDLLETGIDIIAQPPGKKLSSIELMSGGEKALTAVSLIFAIFQIKPSPFCILDEVDAPLDEANVARYNEMVRSMTDRSQFILITHSKRTMQLADVLYGVTMAEPGVSKIVSVKINDTQSNRGVAAPSQAAVA